MRIKGTKAQLEARRRRAAKLLGQGKGVNEVARLIGASPSSISRWKEALRKRGLDGLRGKPDLGRKPRLSKAHKRRPGARPNWNPIADKAALARIRVLVARIKTGATQALRDAEDLQREAETMVKAERRKKSRRA